MAAGGLDLGGATVSGGGADRSGQQPAARPSVARARSRRIRPRDPADLPRRMAASSSRIDLFA